MRGYRENQANFVCLIDVEQLIAPNHPIRTIKKLVDKVLAAMSEHFNEIYASVGAPSVPPETLLKGKLLQALCSVRSDRQLVARLQTDRWSAQELIPRRATNSRGRTICGGFVESVENGQTDDERSAGSGADMTPAQPAVDLNDPPRCEKRGKRPVNGAKNPHANLYLSIFALQNRNHARDRRFFSSLLVRILLLQGFRNSGNDV